MFLVLLSLLCFACFAVVVAAAVVVGVVAAAVVVGGGGRGDVAVALPSSLLVLCDFLHYIKQGRAQIRST